MGHRLSKIVTRTGDAGETGLGDGSRVSKDSPRIEAIGAVDELNSVVGVLLAEALPDAIATCLLDVQHDLFDLGGELSIPGYAAVTDAHVARVEDGGRDVQCRPAAAEGIHPSGRHPRGRRWPTSRAPCAGARSAR